MEAKKLLVSLATLALTLVVITGCGTKKEDTSTKESSSTGESVAEEEEIDFSSLTLPQLNQEVAENEALVEMVTTEGSIKIKLFPELAPKAVESFMTHAKDGYYNDVIFHRVINNFMIQGGDPDGTGMGGESSFGSAFEDEFTPELYNLRGALSMANSGPNTNGSQFFIVQNKDDLSGAIGGLNYPDKIVEAYKNGGTPHLDNVHTVFGQVIEGMDVVDKIAEAEADNDKPVKDIKIQEIKILQEAK